MSDLVIRASALLDLLGNEGRLADAPSFYEAVIACSDELVTMGEPAQAIELIRRSRERADLDDNSVIRIGLVEARAQRLAGRVRDSLEIVHHIKASYSSALENLPLDRASASILEAAALWRLSRTDEAVEILGRIRSELLARPDSVVLASCAFELSSALLFSGKTSEARACALEALVSARRVSSRLFEALAHENLHRLDKAACRWHASEESGRKALELFESASIRIHAGITRISLGIVSWKRGRLQEASGFANSAHEIHVDLGSQVNARAAVLLNALTSLHGGEFSEATGMLTTEDVSSSPRMSLLSTEYLGDVHLEQGQASEALRHYDEAWPKAFALVPKGDIVAELRRRRAECYLLLDRLNEARDEALGALKHCRELGDRYEEAATLRILALTFAALGKPAEAKSWFDLGFAMYEDIETPYEWGKLWMSYGDWLAGPNAGTYGDASAALEAYRIAFEHFDRMGAEAKRAEATARIQRMQPESVPETLATSNVISSHKRPPRRPRMQSELERRSAWARETFGMVTRNRGILGLLDECGKLATTNSPILILGESGCGKELVAAGIHKLSGRVGPYMPLNCTTIPREVFESELFGHLAGSFTGATKDKLGIFEACDGGTVFLDEIAEMPVELQARLLRFLESGEFRRIGATRNTLADTRMIAATNRERAELRRGERFRTDLYYRLAHGVIVLPPLRQRGEDVELLIDHFMEYYNTEQRRHAVLSVEAMDRLLAYAWPGNIRELRSVIRRSVVFSTPGVPIPPEQLDLDTHQVPSNLVEETIQVEKQRIEQVMKQTHGVKSEAARILGLSRTTLISKMKRYGLMD
jgi:DNA-binding NtrC family response regulator/tetratricopeptide (TPR) repeat protein